MDRRSQLSIWRTIGHMVNYSVTNNLDTLVSRTDMTEKLLTWTLSFNTKVFLYYHDY